MGCVEIKFFCFFLLGPMFDKRQQPAAQWCWWRRENVCHEKWKMWKCDQYFVDINLTLMVLLLLLLLVFRKKKEVEKDIIPTLDGFSSFFSVVVVTPKRWAEHARHNRNLYNLKIVTHIKFAKNFHHNWKRQIALLVFPHFHRCYDTARRLIVGMMENCAIHLKLPKSANVIN